MAFNPPLGTTNADVFMGNVQRLDELVNGQPTTVPDRAGDPLYSWRGIHQNLIPLSRQYMTLEAAQADIANIPEGSTTYVRSPDGGTLADEYINNAGTLVATGRKMPSQASTLFGNLDGWANSSLNPFTTFSSPNPNRLTITSAAAATTTYRGASTGLAVAVADGGSLKMAFTYTGPSTNPNLYLRLQAKDGTTWVSSEITISPSAYLQNIEIPVSGGEAATLYCYVRATAALTADLWMLAYTATNNGTTDFILRVLNNELDFGIGVASKWTTSLFDTFTVNGVNSLTYETLTAKYASASAPLSVATGEKIDIYYRVTGATGNPPIVKLVSGSSDASATATLSPSSTVGKVTLTATADATQVLFYVANTAASKGVLWFVAQRATATKSNEYPVKHIIESLNALLPFSENALPVMSGMSSFLATSQNSWTFGATGAAYAEVATAFPAKSAGAVLKFAYAIKSNASATYARLRAGSTFVGDEILLTTDGKLHELELITTAGSKAEKLVIYSRTGPAYTGTAFVSLLAENGVYVSSVAAMEKLAGVLTLDPPPYVESSSPIANAVMQVLNVTSNNSFEFGSDGSGYASVTTSFPQQADGATLRFMYNIDSNAANLYIRLQAGNSWASVETRLITDGTTRYVELATAAGLRANHAVIYARSQAAYTGTAFVALVTANGIYVSSVAAANSLTSGGSGDIEQSTDVIFPSSVCLVAGRQITLYGDNAVAGERLWRGAANVMISSVPDNGKPALLRNALPEVTFYPEEIGGTTLDINARADGGNV
ncbi:TPA: hypothetical protein NPP04_004941, partial [Klebsiella pneumoniae]|nr:hypothetical protein [Klebsiella pneumoniae]